MNTVPNFVIQLFVLTVKIDAFTVGKFTASRWESRIVPSRWCHVTVQLDICTYLSCTYGYLFTPLSI